MPTAKKSAKKSARTSPAKSARKSAAKRAAKKTTAKSAKKAVKKAAKKSTAKSTKTLAKGDHVTWTTSQGETRGVVQRKLTSEMTIKTHKVSASPDNPEYLVKSDKSGELAAHKPGSLHKTAATKKRAAK